MRYALVSDIHANRPAWEAVLADIRAEGVDGVLCMGDIVGYGPSPQWVFDSVVETASLVVLGNHDAVVGDRMDAGLFNDNARKLIDWTRAQLSDSAVKLFSGLPMMSVTDTFLCVHANPVAPDKFGYLLRPPDTLSSFEQMHRDLLFVGHTHYPCLFRYDPEQAQAEYCEPQDCCLAPGFKYIVNVGSVGNPRDGQGMAVYCLYDTGTRQLRFRHLPFDLDAVRKQAEAVRLPGSLSFLQAQAAAEAEERAELDLSSLAMAASSRVLHGRMRRRAQPAGRRGKAGGKRRRRRNGLIILTVLLLAACGIVGALFHGRLRRARRATAMSRQRQAVAAGGGAKVSPREGAPGPAGLSGRQVARGWRSTLYPLDWQPGLTDAEGRSLQDFSYAGYRRGAAPLPASVSGLSVDVTQAPYNADNTGKRDATAAVQRALNDVGSQGGGLVLMPAGTYNVCPPKGEKCALRVQHSNVVLRGDGPEATRICNTATEMRGKAVILVAPGDTTGWHGDARRSAGFKGLADVAVGSTAVSAATGPELSEGDWVYLLCDMTGELAAEYGMSANWGGQQGPKGLVFLRRVVELARAEQQLVFDIPTRLPLLCRDNLRIAPAGKFLSEVGVERLSIGMRENPGKGWAAGDFRKKGTGAYRVSESQLLLLRRVVNGWVRKVCSYRPKGNTKAVHMLSCGVRLLSCRSITVAGCDIGNAQYAGGGRNGACFMIESSDCLLAGCQAAGAGRGFRFADIQTTGNVLYKCLANTADRAVMFGKQLSAANLVDSLTANRGNCVGVPAKWAGDEPSTTESVFWNVSGRVASGKPLVVSRQWRHGYVVGTAGSSPGVDTNCEAAKGDPEDLKEGVGKAWTLVPQSLYVDQRKRRLAGRE